MRTRENGSAAVADRPEADATFPPPAEQPPDIAPPVLKTSASLSSRSAVSDALDGGPLVRRSLAGDLDAVLTGDLFDDVLAPPPVRRVANISDAAPLEQEPPPDTAPKGGGGGAGGQDAAAGGGGGDGGGIHSYGGDAGAGENDAVLSASGGMSLLSGSGSGGGAQGRAAAQARAEEEAIRRWRSRTSSRSITSAIRRRSPT
ncbi:MAG: hypothetical protein WBC44_07320 [Planctomycetaceae bacterium]